MNERDSKSVLLLDGAEGHDLLGTLHDVSNALTVILGWVGAARASDAPADLVHDALGVIERRARMARDLARNALGAHDANGAEIEGQARMQPIDGIVAELLKALSQEARCAGVKLRVERRGPNVTMPHAAAVSQVLTDLTLNAIAFSPKGTAVTLSVDTVAGSCVCRVSDEGPGIATERRDHIFAGGASTRAGGSGVGLRHARALAASCDGHLVLLESALPGAHFELTWPSVQSTPLPVRPSMRRLQLFAGRVFIVCDDDHDVAGLLATGLEMRGAEVQVASTAGELLARLRDESPIDAVLLDRSPVNSHLSELARALSLHPSRPPVLAITGAADGLGPELNGVHVHALRKPFELGDVVEGLAVVLGGIRDA